MVDVIWADRYGREVGYVGKVAGDFTIGTPNTFSLMVPRSLGISEDCYIMIDGTEYGGMVDGIEIDTSQDYVTVSGPTWHGILAAQAVVPDAGQAYYTVTGECNEVIGALIGRIGLSSRMAASDADSGFSVSGWRFSRASYEMDAYTGIRAMLRSVGAKLRIRYDSERRMAVLSAVPVDDYTDDGMDGDRTDFTIRTNRPVNHLHCLGIGEGANRTVIDLFADSSGHVSKTQTIFGMRHRCEVYESSSSDATELEKDGRKRLADLQADIGTCSLSGTDRGLYDIDDIVGGTSTEDGIKVVTTVAQKTAKITSREITYETKTALEA